MPSNLTRPFRPSALTAGEGSHEAKNSLPAALAARKPRYFSALLLETPRSSMASVAYSFLFMLFPAVHVRYFVFALLSSDNQRTRKPSCEAPEWLAFF